MNAAKLFYSAPLSFTFGYNNMIAIIISYTAMFVPIAICVLQRPLNNREIGPGTRFYLAIGIVWISMVFAIYLNNTMIEWRMNSFDIDGDGMINPDEMTNDAQEAVDEFANDSPGSSGYPIFALFGSIIWCSLVFSVSHFAIWIVRLLRKQAA